MMIIMIILSFRPSPPTIGRNVTEIKTNANGDNTIPAIRNMCPLIHLPYKGMIGMNRHFGRYTGVDNNNKIIYIYNTLLLYIHLLSSYIFVQNEITFFVLYTSDIIRNSELSENSSLFQKLKLLFALSSKAKIRRFDCFPW
jgi:hypothetical protein